MDKENTNQLKALLEESRKRPFNKKKILIGSAALALAGALFLGWNSSSKTQPQFVTEPVKTGDLTVFVSANGTLKPQSTVSIGSELSGIVSEVLVDVNDEVKAGDVLIRLDTAKLNANVLQARAGLKTAQANFEEAKALLTEAQLKLARLNRVYQQSKGLAPSKAEIDQQKAAFLRAKASVAAAAARIDDAKALLESRETDLSKAAIISPIDGVVLSRSVEPGYAVAASLQAVELLTIASDLKRLELQIDIDEADVGSVKPGLESSFTVSAYPNQAFEADLTKVSYGATLTNSVVTYTAYLTVNNDQELLRPGMTATARVISQQLSAGTLVPNTALRYQPLSEHKPKSFLPSHRAPLGKKTVKEIEHVNVRRARTVYVLRDGQATPVRIVTGATDGVYSQLISGELAPGDALIIGEKSARR